MGSGSCRASGRWSMPRQVFHPQRRSKPHANSSLTRGDGKCGQRGKWFSSFYKQCSLFPFQSQSVRAREESFREREKPLTKLTALTNGTGGVLRTSRPAAAGMQYVTALAIEIRWRRLG